MAAIAGRSSIGSPPWTPRGNPQCRGEADRWIHPGWPRFDVPQTGEFSLACSLDRCSQPGRTPAVVRAGRRAHLASACRRHQLWAIPVPVSPGLPPVEREHGPCAACCGRPILRVLLGNTWSHHGSHVGQQQGAGHLCEGDSASSRLAALCLNPHGEFSPLGLQDQFSAQRLWLERHAQGHRTIERGRR